MSGSESESLIRSGRGRGRGELRLNRGEGEVDEEAAAAAIVSASRHEVSKRMVNEEEGQGGIRREDKKQTFQNLSSYRPNSHLHVVIELNLFVVLLHIRMHLFRCCPTPGVR